MARCVGPCDYRSRQSSNAIVAIAGDYKAQIKALGSCQVLRTSL